jgi:hypothetical protein
MISQGSQGLAHIATRIVRDLLPMANGPYMATDLALIAGFLNLLSQDYDRAAEVLTLEYADIITVVRAARSLLSDELLQQRIDALTALEPTSLRIADLTARTDTALRVLIEVHAAVETAADSGIPGAADLNLQIWAFLEQQLQRRAYRSGR